MPITQPVIGLYDGLFEILLETGRQHGLTDLSPLLTEIVQVARVQPMEYLCDPLIQPGLAKKRAIGLGRNGKPIGNLHTP